MYILLYKLQFKNPDSPQVPIPVAPNFTSSS